MNQKKVLLVDGMALLFRGYFATAVHGNFMRNAEGTPTNGVNGFIKYFLHAVETFQPTHVVCCWDMGSHTFRSRLYPEYKANRSEPPEELIPQFEMAKEVMTGFNVPNVGIPDFEADDCIGTLAAQLAPENFIYILTGDQDMLQLINNNISVVIMKKGRGNYQVFNESNMVELKGCSPAQLVDIKGLMGDTSDNYPGVKGIGEKTALKLVQEFESIENILINLDKLKPGQRLKIETEKQMLDLSRDLARIRTDAPVELSLNEAVWSANKDQASACLSKRGIKISLMPPAFTDSEIAGSK
ncbi:5'-3' exonuclease H3TH domain-containing protein [Alteribacillus sp. HJP-4]|uniref:5'-3' exonuclease n=1 Tax=Alteribacillus sp. HJP-4 TaxID=2775394 RepID=UPI0035CD2C3E